MKPSFLEGALVAAVVSIAGSMVYHLLRPGLGGDLLLQGLSAAIGFGYVLYLINRSGLRGGRMTILALWLIAASVIAWVSPSVLATVCAHIALVWLVRACTYHTGLVPAFADFCLSGGSLLAAGWAVSQTHSLFVSLWCLMLVQAMFSFIPSRSSSAAAQSAGGDESSFESAARNAEAALRALSSVR